MKAAYLGIDVGSITVNLAVTDDEGRLLYKKYLRTHGQPVQVMQTGLRELAHQLGGARGGVVHRKGALEQVAQSVTDQGRVLRLGIIQGHTHDLGRVARLLE